MRRHVALLLAAMASLAACDRATSQDPPAPAAPAIAAPAAQPPAPAADPTPTPAPAPVAAADAQPPRDADPDDDVFALVGQAQREVAEAARDATRLAGEVDDIVDTLGKTVSDLKPPPSPAKPDEVAAKPKPDPKPKSDPPPAPPKSDPPPTPPTPEPPKGPPKGSGRKLARLSGALMKLSQEIEFVIGGANISPASALLVEDIALEMLSHSGKEFCILGHTSSEGADSFNLKLSDVRAKAVRRRLIEHTVPADRVSAQGCGERAPLASNDTTEGRSRNRRFVITTLGCDCFADRPRQP